MPQDNKPPMQYYGDPIRVHDFLRTTEGGDSSLHSAITRSGFIFPTERYYYNDSAYSAPTADAKHPNLIYRNEEYGYTAEIPAEYQFLKVVENQDKEYQIRFCDSSGNLLTTSQIYINLQGQSIKPSSSVPYVTVQPDLHVSPNLSSLVSRNIDLRGYRSDPDSHHIAELASRSGPSMRIEPGYPHVCGNVVTSPASVYAIGHDATLDHTLHNTDVKTEIGTLNSLLATFQKHNNSLTTFNYSDNNTQSVALFPEHLKDLETYKAALEYVLQQNPLYFIMDHAGISLAQDYNGAELLSKDSDKLALFSETGHPQNDNKKYAVQAEIVSDYTSPFQRYTACIGTGPDRDPIPIATLTLSGSMLHWKIHDDIESPKREEVLNFEEVMHYLLPVTIIVFNEDGQLYLHTTNAEHRKISTLECVASLARLYTHNLKPPLPDLDDQAQSQLPDDPEPPLPDLDDQAQSQLPDDPEPPLPDLDDQAQSQLPDDPEPPLPDLDDQAQSQLPDDPKPPLPDLDDQAQSQLPDDPKPPLPDLDDQAQSQLPDDPKPPLPDLDDQAQSQLPDDPKPPLPDLDDQAQSQLPDDPKPPLPDLDDQAQSQLPDDPKPPLLLHIPIKPTATPIPISNPTEPSASYYQVTAGTSYGSSAAVFPQECYFYSQGNIVCYSGVGYATVIPPKYHYLRVYNTGPKGLEEEENFLLCFCDKHGKLLDAGEFTQCHFSLFSSGNCGDHLVTTSIQSLTQACQASGGFVSYASSLGSPLENIYYEHGDEPCYRLSPPPGTSGEKPEAVNVFEISSTDLKVSDTPSGHLDAENAIFSVYPENIPQVKLAYYAPVLSDTMPPNVNWHLHIHPFDSHVVERSVLNAARDAVVYLLIDKDGLVLSHTHGNYPILKEEKDVQSLLQHAGILPPQSNTETSSEPIKEKAALQLQIDIPEYSAHPHTQYPTRIIAENAMGEEIYFFLPPNSTTHKFYFHDGIFVYKHEGNPISSLIPMQCHKPILDSLRSVYENTSSTPVVLEVAQNEYVAYKTATLRYKTQEISHILPLETLIQKNTGASLGQDVATFMQERHPPAGFSIYPTRAEIHNLEPWDDHAEEHDDDLILTEDVRIPESYQYKVFVNADTPYTGDQLWMNVNYDDMTNLYKHINDKFYLDVYTYKEAMKLYDAVISGAHTHQYAPFRVEGGCLKNGHVKIDDYDFGSIEEFTSMFLI